MKPRFAQIITLAAGIVFTAALHIFLFGDSGYFTRLSLENRLHAMKEQIAELERENDRLADEYAQLEESKTQLATPEGATILQFEDPSRTEASAIASNMERSLADPETIFFLVMGLLTLSVMLIIRIAGSMRGPQLENP